MQAFTTFYMDQIQYSLKEFLEIENIFIKKNVPILGFNLLSKAKRTLKIIIIPDNQKN